MEQAQRLLESIDANLDILNPGRSGVNWAHAGSSRQLVDDLTVAMASLIGVEPNEIPAIINEVYA